MREDLQRQCDILLDNYDRIHKKETWSFNYISLAAAGLFMAMRQPIDFERIHACRRIIHQKKGLFSEFRDAGEYLICCKMSMSEDPEEYFDNVAAIYEELHTGIFGDPFSIVAAMIITEGCAPKDYHDMTERTKAIFRDMKDHHRFLTTDTNMPFAALTALTWQDTARMSARMEHMYSILEENFKGEQKTKQLISQIMALYDLNDEEMCRTVCDIQDRLISANHSPGGRTSAAILGTLVDTGVGAYDLAADIIDADDHLSGKPPFKGLLALDANMRRMFAVLAVESTYFDFEQASRSAMVSATVSLAVVIELIMMAAVVAAC